MAITNKQSGTNVYEVAEGIYRINTPVFMDGGPGVNADLKLIQICSERRFKSDTPPLRLHTAYAS
jgi:hypothetical protein